MTKTTKWARARANARLNRRDYTDVLKAHGVTNKGYVYCTDVVYVEIIGDPAFRVRIRRKLPPKVNLRDHLDLKELTAVTLAEALAAERIEDEMLLGNDACREATAACARDIAKVISRHSKAA